MEAKYRDKRPSHGIVTDISLRFFAAGYYSIQCPNKILNTIWLAVGNFSKDLSEYFFSEDLIMMTK